MTRASHGFRQGTRKKLTKRHRAKFTVTPYLRVFAEGDRVVVKQNPSSHKGMPHPRFKGLAGEVVGRRGDAYIVKIKSGNKTKTLIATPEHIEKLGG